MKNRLLLLLVLPLLIGSTAYFFTRTLTPLEPRVEAPALIDVGPQEVGRRVSFQCSIRNIGHSPLELRDFKSSCGCLFAERLLPSGERVHLGDVTLAPGEELLAVGELVIRGEAGQALQASITCHTNDPERPDLRLSVVSVASGRVVAVPKELALGVLPRGQTIRTKVQFRDLGLAEPCRLASVVSGEPELVSIERFEARDEIADPNNPKLGRLFGVCELTVRCPQEPQTIATRLTVYGESEGEQAPLLIVPVSGIVQPRFEFSPGTIVLPRTTGEGWTNSINCLCRNNDGQPFHLLAVDSPKDDVAVQITLNRRNPALAFVNLAWKADRVPAAGTRVRREIQFRARVGNTEEMLTLPVTWWRPESP